MRISDWSSDVCSSDLIGVGLPVNTVGDMGKLPEGLQTFALQNVPLNWETLQIILPYSLTMAAVGLLDSLLTAQIVDDMTDTDRDQKRKCAGHGGAKSIDATFGGDRKRVVEVKRVSVWFNMVGIG